jgi:hypothetical protein
MSNYLWVGVLPQALFHRFLVPFFPFKGVFPELNDGT